MPLDALDLVVLFACGYSLIQSRLLTDDFFPRFRWSCLTVLRVDSAVRRTGMLRWTHAGNGAYKKGQEKARVFFHFVDDESSLTYRA